MPQLRKDPIIGRWAIISTSRGKKPNDFQSLKNMKDLPSHQDGCPFCNGNESMTPPEISAMRSNEPNSPGWDVRVIPNKFPALGVEGDLDSEGDGMYDLMNGIGAHEVIIDSPLHNKRIADHTPESWKNVLQMYKDRFIDLKNDSRFRYILIFRNSGEAAGASLIHPHSQLIATPIIPKRVKEELKGAQEYYNLKDRCAFCDMIRQEIKDKKRLVYENDAFIAFCPFASRFPFEVWILPKKHSPDFEKITDDQMSLLADMKIQVYSKLDKALNYPHYNYVVHTGPVRRPKSGYWVSIDQDFHWHIEIMPRLVRTAGFEWGTGFYINPTPPEKAAEFLRSI